MTDSKTQTFNSGKPVTNCDKLDPVGSTALRDDEAVYWVSIGHYEAVAVGD